jgi:iron complex outermembrane receptor protein
MTVEVRAIVQLAVTLSLLGGAVGVWASPAGAQEEGESSVNGHLPSEESQPLITNDQGQQTHHQPATTVEEWVAQIEASHTQITAVRVEATETGLQVILETENGSLDVPETRSVGNALIADIPNAAIAEEFSQAEPIEGIALVNVTSLPGDRVRVAITGTDAPPVAEVTSEAQGLAFAVRIGDAGTAAEDDAIQVVVTGEQDTGYRVPDASVGTRTDTPLRDIPQSIQVLPQEVFRDQQSYDVEQVLQNAPGVVQGDRSPRYPYTEFFVRGFVSGTETLVNGLPSTVFQYRDVLSNIERIEVLRGPSSVLFGPGSLGGRINVVTERPLRDPFYSIDVSAGNFNLYNGAIDLSGPLDDDRTLLYRFNAFAETTDSFIDFYERERYLVSPVLTWLIDEQTELTVETEYVYSAIDGIDNGLPAEGTVLPNPNGEIPLDRNLGEPSFFNNTETFRVGYDFEHRFSENWQMRSAFQFFLYNDEARGFFYGDLSDDQRTVERFAAQYRIENRAYNLDNYVVGEFATGSIQHQLVVGLNLFRQDFTVPFDNDLPGLEPINIFDPVYDVSTLGEPVPVRRLDRQINQLGIYLQDQITLTENLKLLLGGRFDIAGQREENLLESTSQFQQDTAFSPRIGIVYQPLEPISLYASYNRSFFPQVGTDAEGSAFDPERGTQYEIGVKADINDRLFATLALYHLTRTNVLTSDLSDPRFSVQTGEQRSRGIEFDISGEILPGWNIVAGYALTDAEITEDNFFEEGNELAGIPRHTFNLWTTYEIQSGDFRGLGAGIGVFYVGDRQGDLENTFELPSYLRTDAALFYNRDNFRIALNIRNLFDIEYFLSANADNPRLGVHPGEPLSVVGSISWQF